MGSKEDGNIGTSASLCRVLPSLVVPNPTEVVLMCTLFSELGLGYEVPDY